VPAIIVSPWVEPGSVFNVEYRHTSLIATLRKTWDLGDPLTARDAAARTFEQVFTRHEPTDPLTWTKIQAQPVPEWTLDPEVLGRTLSGLGKAAIPGLIAHAREMGVRLPAGVDDPDADPAVLLRTIRDIGIHYFPALAEGALAHDQQD
jgi:phospholipase C